MARSSLGGVKDLVSVTERARLTRPANVPRDRLRVREQERSTDGIGRRVSGPRPRAFASRGTSCGQLYRRVVARQSGQVDRWTRGKQRLHAAAENDGSGRGADSEVVPPGTLGTQEMIINIGPQHPSTHGVLRLVLELDGEVITRAEPVIGYMHRGAEKLAEHRDARQVLVLMNRHDWLSAFNNELGWIIAVERLARIEVPERAQWIRTAGRMEPHLEP